MPLTQAPPPAVELAALVTQMAHPSSHGGLWPRDAAMASRACRALVAGLLAIRSRLDALDGRPTPDPDPMAGLADLPLGASFDLGLARPWRTLEALAGAILDVEARLRALEGLPPIGPAAESPAACRARRIVDQVALDGAMHRDPEEWWRVVQGFVPRVLAIDARVDAIESNPRKASK